MLDLEIKLIRRLAEDGDQCLIKLVVKYFSSFVDCKKYVIYTKIKYIFFIKVHLWYPRYNMCIYELEVVYPFSPLSSCLQDQ